MKNIHLLPTEKPSRLWYNNLSDTDELLLSIEEVKTSNNQHIYITSNKEIKKADWVFVEGQLSPQKAKGVLPNGDIECENGIDYVNRRTRKIILTTDPDLIADGVQAIDDEFLEWFVKNPTAKYVTVKRLEDGKYVDYLVDGSAVEGVYENYKIILPQEEPNPFELPKTLPDDVFYQSLEEPKQETLKEAAKKYATSTADNDPVRALSFIQGVKWLSERVYSEEEVRKAIQLARLCTLDNVTGEFVELSGLTEVCTYGLEETHSEDSIIEQFKKK